jgi:hypothetical protein
MRQIFAIYILPTTIVNLGYVFTFLFQLVLASALTIGEVGAFNASFSLVNILAAPTSILAFARSRVVDCVSAKGRVRYVLS